MLTQAKRKLTKPPMKSMVHTLASATPSIKILISGGLASGGPQTHTVALCKLLRDAGVHVTLIGGSVGWNNEALLSVLELGVQVTTPRYGKLGKLLFLATAFLSLRGRFDVVLCMGTSSLHRHACGATKLDGFKIYNEIIPRPNQTMWPVIRRMDGLIGISKFNCGELQRLFPDQPTRRLPHIFNASSAAVSEARRPVLASRPLQFAYLGRIDAGKRPYRLVAEWKDITLDAKLGTARLDIFGAGSADMVSRIKELIWQEDLAAVVAYRGPYAASQLDGILAGVDVVLHPSQWEGLGLVPLEAMQRGVPVVATEAGGTAELGEDNPDALITPGEDWGAFRAGIGEVVARLRAGAISSSRLQQWVEARYGRDRLCQQWLEAVLNPRKFFNACT